MHPIASLALATGMRRGELLALRWQDVDLAKASLKVERSLEQTKAGLRFKSPKSKHGFGNMDAGDPSLAVEIGKGARHTQSAVIARALKPSASAASCKSVRPAESGAAISSSRLPSQSALVRARGCLSAAKRSAWIARAAATRARTSALPSDAAGSTRSAAETAGTSICRSIRSSSGPEMRAW